MDRFSVARRFITQIQDIELPDSMSAQFKEALFIIHSAFTARTGVATHGLEGASGLSARGFSSDPFVALSLTPVERSLWPWEPRGRPRMPATVGLNPHAWFGAVALGGGSPLRFTLEGFVIALLDCP